MNFPKIQGPTGELLQKSNLRVMVSMFVVGLLAGSLISGVYFSRKTSQAQKECGKQTADSKENTIAPGISNVPKINIPDQVFGIGGSIEKINGDTLTLNALLYGEQRRYTVKVTDSTKIIKREISKNPSMPEKGKLTSPFEETEIGLSDLRVNDNVGIISSENIKDKNEFEAKTISLEIMK